MKVAIELPSGQAAQLESEAKRLGVSVEDFARAAVTDLLAAPDTAFQASAKRILAQNMELYRRLVYMRYLTLGEVVAHRNMSSTVEYMPPSPTTSRMLSAIHQAVPRLTYPMPRPGIGVE